MKEQESEKKLQKKTTKHSLTIILCKSVEYNYYTVQKPPSVHTSLI